LAIPLSAQQWNGLSFYNFGKDTLVNPLDGVNPKAKIMVVNTGLQAARRIRVEVSSPDIPNPGGGMAIFPNGGFLYLAPGETTFVSCWTRAVYEGGGSTPVGSYFQRRFVFRFRPDIPGDTSSFSFERALVFCQPGISTPAFRAVEREWKNRAPTQADQPTSNQHANWHTAFQNAPPDHAQ